MDMETEVYGEYSLEEIKRGYIEEEDGFTCLLCGEYFAKGEIYSFSGRLYEASKAVQVHIKQAHQSVKSFLLDMRASYMGISELQLQLINFFAKGVSDKDVADYLGVSGSTIRNHRFKLRERERQNKIFLALMELLEEERGNKNSKKEIIRLNNETKEQHLEKQIGEKERKKVIERYMTVEGRLKSYPSYERSKRVILESILDRFSIGKQYREEEINEALKQVYKDYFLLKEELMDYGYLGRSNKGGIYWIRNYKQLA